MGRHRLEQGDNIILPGISLTGTGSLAITFDDTGTNGLTLDFLVALNGTTPVTIDSTGAMGGFNVLPQLLVTNNDPTTVTIKGSESFFLGHNTGLSNSGDGVVTDIIATASSPETIHSALTLIGCVSDHRPGGNLYSGCTYCAGG